MKTKLKSSCGATIEAEATLTLKRLNETLKRFNSSPVVVGLAVRPEHERDLVESLERERKAAASMRDVLKLCSLPVIKDSELLTPWQAFRSRINWDLYRKAKS